MSIPTPTASQEIAASIPPASVAALSLMGVGLQDWVLIATLVWLTAQISWFVITRFREWKNGNK